MSVAGRSEEEYVVDGNEVLEMKLVREPSDLTKDTLSFKPTMCHQIFGPQETIYGYKNLKIQLYFSAGLLTPYLGITYSEKINAKRVNGVEADNIEQILSEKLEIKLNRNLDVFTGLLKNDLKFKPMGTLKHTFKVATDDGEKCFVIYKCETSTIGLIPYHERLQTFIYWFIDAASFIEVDDDKWQFFLLFEKCSVGGDELYAIAGFATVYEYYAYPEHLRPRLSQMLVLPPFQHQGLGAELLHTIYRHYQDQPRVRDITVEDPSEELQSVRDFVDCELVSQLPELRGVKTPTLEMVQQAAEKLKINKKQARRVYEILRLVGVSRLDPAQYRDYRLEVKRRLNIAHQNEKTKLKKLQQLMRPAEVAELENSLMLSEEHRLATLDNTYQELEKTYDRVVHRLQAL